jgi:hypothetical protein
MELLRQFSESNGWMTVTMVDTQIFPQRCNASYRPARFSQIEKRKDRLAKGRMHAHCMNGSRGEFLEIAKQFPTQESRNRTWSITWAIFGIRIAINRRRTLWQL